MHATVVTIWNGELGKRLSWMKQLDLNEKDIDFARLQQDFEGYTQRKLKENDLLNLRLLREKSGKLYPTIQKHSQKASQKIIEFMQDIILL